MSIPDYEDTTITKCESDDPNRCTTITGRGQCLNLSVVGGPVCRIHGGNMIQAGQEKIALKNYRLTKFRAQIGRLGTSDGIKSLRDEIGILRVIMEEKLNMCEDATELMMQSQTISDLAMKIEKMVTSCSKLESSLGQTMDKQALLSFASGVIGIIGELVDDTDVLDIIGDRILKLVSSPTEDGNV